MGAHRPKRMPCVETECADLGAVMGGRSLKFALWPKQATCISDLQYGSLILKAAPKLHIPAAPKLHIQAARIYVLRGTLLCREIEPQLRMSVLCREQIAFVKSDSVRALISVAF